MFAKLRGKMLLIVLAGMLLLLSQAGCSERRGQVSGRVRYAGQPLPGGTIVLRDSAGEPHHGSIEADGRFRIADVSLGEAQVGVSSFLELLPPGGSTITVVASRVNEPAAVSSRIPVHYGDLGRSGLTVRVEKDSTLELELK